MCRLMAKKKKKWESVLQSGLCSQLRLEYHHQDGWAHSNSNSIRQAEKEGGQERHNPHTLEERERRNKIKIWEGEKKDSTILHARLFSSRSPICSFSTSNKGRRAAGACSSGSPQSRLRAPTEEKPRLDLSYLRLNVLSIFFKYHTLLSAYFWKWLQVGSQGKHGDHHDQHHTQTGELREGSDRS